jgi:oxygen-independent coproporphyrinogen-3 oxidase
MLQAAAYLDAQGFARYEVASYARAGKACRHNQAYWTGRSYLGLGTAAASMLTAEEYARLRMASTGLPDLPLDAQRVRLTCTSLPDEVCAAPGLADLAWDVEFLSAREAAAEDLMLGTRMSAGASAEVVRRARGVIGAARVDAAIADVVGRGLATLGAGGALAPTARGWLLGNELYGALWDLARD